MVCGSARYVYPARTLKDLLMSILQTQSRLVAEYQALPDWESRYQKIIALGRALPPLPEEFRTDDNKVRGCSSTVWLHATSDGERVVFMLTATLRFPKGWRLFWCRSIQDSPPRRSLRRRRNSSKSWD